MGGPPPDELPALQEPHAGFREECPPPAPAMSAAGGVDAQPILFPASCAGDPMPTAGLAFAVDDLRDRWDDLALRLQAEAAAAGLRRPASPSGGIETERPARGVLATRLADDRLAIRVERAAAGGLFRPDQHLLAGALTEDESWRRDVDISLQAAPSDGVGVSVTGGYFDMRQPFLSGGRSHRAFSEFTRWRENGVVDLGLKLDVPDRGLRYGAGFSRSQYGATRPTRLRVRSGDARRPFERSAGWSHWHRLEADLWQGSDGAASVYGLYGVADTAYRSLRRRSASPLVYDGETAELGGTVRLGPGTLGLSHQTVAGESLARRETKGRLRVGPLRVAVAHGGWTSFDDDAADAWWWRERFWNGSVRLALLAPHVGDTDRGLARLLPESVTFKGARTWIRSSFLDDQPADVRTRLELGLAWSGESWITDLSLSRTATDRPATEWDRADSAEVTLDLVQSFFGDWWDVSAYVSLSDSRVKDNSSRDRLFGGGMSFSLDSEEFPKLSVGIDLNRFEMLFPDIDYGFRDHGLNFNVTVDFSKYLPVVDPERKPYLKLRAYSDWSLSDDTDTGRSLEAGHTVLAFFGMNF